MNDIKNESYIHINTHGAYQVDIPDTDNSQSYAVKCKTFFPSTYGGADQALEAAIKWRNKVGSELYGETFDLMLKRGIKMPKRKIRKGTRHPITPGVHVKYRNNQPYSVDATWVKGYDGNKKLTGSKSFSIKRFGLEKATELALQAREKGVRDYLNIETEKPKRKTRRILSRFYRSKKNHAWVVVWFQNDKRHTRKFKDSDYSVIVEGRPSSWWGFIESVHFLRKKQQNLFGKTYLPSTENKLRNLYFQKMQSSE